MNLIEDIFTIQTDGNLLIPKKYLEEFELSPGEEVTISFLTEDCQSNTYHELIAYPTHFGPNDMQTLFIPEDMLQEANLSTSVDLQIICLQKAIIIYEADRYTAEDLQDILGGLEIASAHLLEHNTYHENRFTSEEYHDD